MSREKSNSNLYESNENIGSKRTSGLYETGNNFYSNKNQQIINKPNEYNNTNENAYSSVEKNKFVNNNKLSPILPINNICNNYSNINSKNNSNPISPKVNTNQESRDEIKEFLLKVKEKIPAKDFKEFISDIKLLTDKNNICNKKEIINHVNSIFQNHRDLYNRFEEILLIKKN